MIKGIYEGYNYLDILLAYKNIAWDGIFSSGSADDPCVNSLSNFKRICSDNNITIDYLTEWEKIGFDLAKPQQNELPIIFIISSYSKNIERILDWVKLGANLVFIKSSPTYIREDNFEKNQSKTIMKINKITNTNIINKMNILFGHGKIFYVNQNLINDLKIEPGPFGAPNIDVKNIKIEKIKHVVSEISLFDLKILDATINSQVITQPINEVLFIEIKVKNISKNRLNKVNIEIIYPDEIYSISNVVIEENFIESNSIFTIKQFCKPIKKGILNTKITLKIKIDNISSRNIYIPFNIKVIESYKNLLGESIPQNLNMSKLLDEYQNLFKPPFNSLIFKSLINIDPETLVIKIRKIAESLVKRIYAKKIKEGNPNLNFASTIFELHKQNIIDNKMNGFINTVRILGNYAAHSNSETGLVFNEKDAYAISNAFISFVADCVEKKIL